MMERPGTNAIILTLGLGMAVTMAGCGVAPDAGSNAKGPVTIPALRISGHAMGGQQPISGAIVELYGVNTTTLKGASQPLMAPVNTQADGSFSITGDYHCPGGDILVYLTATQGNPGVGLGNNGAIALMAVLGSCDALLANGAATSININELTTTAAAYALGGFMGDVQHVGAPANFATGMANGFRMAGVLADTSTGVSPGPLLTSNASLSVATINTVADILASCVNSDGATTDGTPCGTLFNDTTIAGLGYSPQDTATAAVNLVTHPGASVSDLFGLVYPTAPFQPSLTVAPNDWTVAVRYTGGGLATPYGVAVDTSGNAWVTNESGNSITEIETGGTLLSGSSGYTGGGAIFGAKSVAIDATGRAWIANTAGNSVVVLNGDGSLAGNYTAGGIDGPVSIAMDSAGDAWVANFTGNSVTVLNGSGTPIDSSPLTAGGVLSLPTAVAIDSSGNTWIANTGTQALEKFTNSGALLSSTGNGYSDGNLLEPLSVAFDGSGNAWIADYGLNAVDSLTPAGASSTQPVLGYSVPRGVALDGAGVIWATNGSTAGSLASFVPGSRLVNSYGSLQQPVGLAVDASGNLWTANASDNSVSEFVGLAMPTSTPLIRASGP